MAVPDSQTTGRLPCILPAHACRASPRRSIQTRRSLRSRSMRSSHSRASAGRCGNAGTMRRWARAGTRPPVAATARSRSGGRWGDCQRARSSPLRSRSTPDGKVVYVHRIVARSQETLCSQVMASTPRSWRQRARTGTRTVDESDRRVPFDEMVCPGSVSILHAGSVRPQRAAPYFSSSALMAATLPAERPCASKPQLRNASAIDLASSGPMTRAPIVMIWASLDSDARSAE